MSILPESALLKEAAPDRIIQHGHRVEEVRAAPVGADCEGRTVSGQVEGTLAIALPH